MCLVVIALERFPVEWNDMRPDPQVIPYEREPL
jgi:hypothetical protein